MGRHADSGSDGVDRSEASVAARRRRTDAPDGLWSGAPSAELSDQQTDIARVRNDRRRESLLAPALEASRRAGARTPVGASAGAGRSADGARQMSRPRLPLPPVPAGPRTTAAPFRAVPSPEIPVPVGAPEAFVPEPAPVGAPMERRRSRSSAPTARPERSWRAEEAAPPVGRGARSSVPAPRVPRPAGPADPSSPAYGDWTKPSGADLAEMASVDEAGRLAGSPGSSRRRPAPDTSLIPDRALAGRRGAVEDEYDVDDAPRSAGPVTGAGVRGPGTGPVGSGRASRRIELQKADLARREAAKRNGTPIVSPLDEENSPRRSRVVLGLVAMVVVALGVLGVYQVVSPNTDAAGSQASAAETPAPVTPEISALPTLPSAPAVEPTVAAPVKAPVTVLNATQTTGLAARIAATVAAGGWETPAVGQYTATDVAASTVFFTEGNETQRQAAIQLIAQFPQLTGPAPRFFEVPADIAAPGLVIVTTGDWQP